MHPVPACVDLIPDIGSSTCHCARLVKMKKSKGTPYFIFSLLTTFIYTPYSFRFRRKLLNDFLSSQWERLPRLQHIPLVQAISSRGGLGGLWGGVGHGPLPPYYLLYFTLNETLGRMGNTTLETQIPRPPCACFGGSQISKLHWHN